MATNWQIGDRIQNRWEIHDIKRGGMGIVYFCTDQEDGAPCALKTFQDKYALDQAAKARFAQEAYTWIQLAAHRNIVQALRVEVVDDRPFIVLEWVQGAADGTVHADRAPDLRSWLRTGPLSPATALDVGIQCCMGMLHMATRVPGMVHRDLKPENILIRHDGAAKVTDFGLTKLVVTTPAQGARAAQTDERTGDASPMFTQPGAIPGTLPYMSPEQLRGMPLDVRSDIFAFGCVLYEMIAGQPLIQMRDIWEAIHGANGPDTARLASSMPWIPVHLRAPLSGCLSDLGHRFADFRQVAESLEECYKLVTGKPPAVLVELGFGIPGVWVAMPCETVADACALQQGVNPMEVLERAGMGSPRWIEQGESFARLGRFTEAIECFDAALKSDPRDAVAQVRMSAPPAVQAMLAEWEARDGDPWTDSQIDTWFAHAWFGKGSCYMQLAQYEEAAQCFDRSIALQPNSFNARFNYGLTLSLIKRYAEAATSFERALEVNPNYAPAWEYRGDALWQLGRREEASMCFARAVGIDPRSDSAWVKQGRALLLLDRTAEASTCYVRALEINQRNQDAWFGRGLILAGDRRQIQEAIHSLEEAQRLGHPSAAAVIAELKQTPGR